MSNNLEGLIKYLTNEGWLQGLADPKAKEPRLRLFSGSEEQEWYIPPVDSTEVVKGACAVTLPHKPHRFPVNLENMVSHYIQQCDGVAGDLTEYWAVVDDIVGQTIICDVPSEALARRFASNYANSTVRMALRVQRQDHEEGGVFSYIRMSLGSVKEPDAGKKEE